MPRLICVEWFIIHYSTHSHAVFISANQYVKSRMNNTISTDLPYKLNHWLTTPQNHKRKWIRPGRRPPGSKFRRFESLAASTPGFLDNDLTLEVHYVAHHRNVYDRNL
jgi:hypothetical protein